MTPTPGTCYRSNVDGVNAKAIFACALVYDDATAVGGRAALFVEYNPTTPARDLDVIRLSSAAWDTLKRAARPKPKRRAKAARTPTARSTPAWDEPQAGTR